MKYFHRTHLSPDAVLARAAQFFGARLTPVEEHPRRRRFTGTIGQVGESEADKLAKRFLTLVHTMAEPTHRAIGAY
jgi:hypothetical protein